MALSCLWCVSGRVEGDLVRGDGVPTSFGGVVIHRGHMRLLDLSTKAYHALFEHLEQSGRLVREVEAQGWAPFLDRTGELLPSRPAPCARCHRPQTQCRVGLPLSDAPWDPALSPTLPARVPLSERPAFQHGVYVQEVFAGWAGWTAGMVQQGFRSALPIQYFEDPLSMTGPKPEFDLRDFTVRSALLEQAKAPPEADVPNLWQFGTPCTTFCDYQRLI